MNFRFIGTIIILMKKWYDQGKTLKIKAPGCFGGIFAKEQKS